MSKVLILTHSTLAGAMYKTGELICGTNQNVSYIDMPKDLNIGEYKKAVEQIVDKSDDGVLIITDLLGGSPFIISSNIVRDKWDKVELVTGCNMAMIITAIQNVDDLSIEELKKAVLKAGKDGIVDIKERMSK